MMNLTDKRRNMRHNLLVCFLAVLGMLLHAPLWGNDNPRRVVTLDKGWGYKPLTDNKRGAELTPVTLPHTWNADYLEGTTQYNREMMVYKRNLTRTPDMRNKRLFLYFEGVNSAADVFVNYRTVGRHLGGYTAFCLEITDFLKEGDNDIEVWASNAYRTDILPISGDFNIYGGIHRPCHLIVTEKNCISPIFYASSGVFIRQDKVTDNRVDFTVESILLLKGERGNLTLKSTLLDAEGNNVASISSGVTDERMIHKYSLPNLTLWNGKQNPYIYKVKVQLYDGEHLVDEVTEQTGFRYFHVDPDKGFFLNGKPLSLHGFNRHDDFKGRGSALLAEHYEKDMELIKELGATAMRLAHYPHGKPIYDLCDKNGVILWTEIPLCGPGGYAYTGYLHNQPLEDNARQVLKELVYQKFNHPSILFWGIFNELLLSDGKRFQEYDNPVAFVKELNALYKQLDPSRLTTFATCVDQTPYLGCADLVAWNKYFSWHSSEQQAGEFFDEARRTSGNYPVGVSEYGSGGSPKQHACPLETDIKLPAGYHPEEHQAVCHEGYWSAFVQRPYLWAKLIWQFSNMQSYFRNEGDTPGINDKGCVTYDRQTKKDIFYFYKANWNPEPMLYLCSRRFTERTKPLTQVKAYSNLKEATLYVNGKKIGRQKRDHVNRMIWNDVTLLPGKNEIRIEGKNGKQTLTDICTWELN